MIVDVISVKRSFTNWQVGMGNMAVLKFSFMGKLMNKGEAVERDMRDQVMAQLGQFVGVFESK